MAKVYLRGGRWFVGDQRLTNNEATILFAAMAHRRVTINDLVEMIYPNPDAEPEWAAAGVRQFCLRLRRKLRPFGWTIRGVPGQRWPTCGVALEPLAA